MPHPDTVSEYHAHIYFEPAQRDAALQLRSDILAHHLVRPGGWRDQRGGPHPRPDFLVVFDAAEFGRLVPWLMLNRQGFDVLVHPESGDPVADHSTHALWLGRPLTIDLDYLRRFEAQHQAG